MIEPIFEKINYNAEPVKVFEQIKAECKTDVLSESVKSILNVSACVALEEAEYVDKKVDYLGKVIFYVCYVDADGEIKKVECGNEFSGGIKCDNQSANAKVYATAVVDKTETELSGARLTLGAYITVSAKLVDSEAIDVVGGGESLIVDTAEIPLVKSLGIRRGSYPIEEEFELNYAVKEVLLHRVQTVITSVQCGVGVIIVDGEAVLSAIMLQKTDKSDIIKEIRILPFRMEIDCEQAMPTMQATARAKEKSFKLDVLVNEDNGKSTLNLSAVLAFEGEAFSVESVVVAGDAFSTQEDVQVDMQTIPCSKPCEMRTWSANVSGRSAVEELPAGAIILAVGGERTEITSVEVLDGVVKITGVLCAVGFFRDGENKPFTRKMEIPFESKCEYLLENGLVDCEAKGLKGRARITSNDEIELECEVVCTAYPIENSQTTVVKDIKALGEKKQSTCALSVYIPSEGEELWSLSKRLNVAPDALVQANPELCFPLSGDERIVVYRQK